MAQRGCVIAYKYIYIYIYIYNIDLFIYKLFIYLFILSAVLFAGNHEGFGREPVG